MLIHILTFTRYRLHASAVLKCKSTKTHSPCWMVEVGVARCAATGGGPLLNWGGQQMVEELYCSELLWWWYLYCWWWLVMWKQTQDLKVALLVEGLEVWVYSITFLTCIQNQIWEYCWMNFIQSTTAGTTLDCSWASQIIPWSLSSKCT